MQLNDDWLYASIARVLQPNTNKHSYLFLFMFFCFSHDMNLSYLITYPGGPEFFSIHLGWLNDRNQRGCLTTSHGLCSLPHTFSFDFRLHFGGGFSLLPGFRNKSTNVSNIKGSKKAESAGNSFWKKRRKKSIRIRPPLLRVSLLKILDAIYIWSYYVV